MSSNNVIPGQVYFVLRDTAGMYVHRVTMQIMGEQDLSQI